MPRWLRLALLLTVAALESACATLKSPDLSTLVLPAPSATTCCWQAVDKVELTHNRQRFVLQTVTAVQQQSIVLVVLDPLGRKIISVTQEGDVVRLQRFADLPKGVPVQWLYPIVILSHAKVESWNLSQTPWVLQEKEGRLLLNYANRKVLTIEGYLDGQLPDVGSEHRVNLHDSGLEILVTSIAVKAL